MKRIIISVITLLLLFTTEKASAQYYFYDNNYYDSKFTFEFGGSLGVMNCLTDIGGKLGIGGPFLKDLNIGNTKFQGGVFFSATYNYAVGLRIEYTSGEVSAYDSILKPVADNSDGRYQRNLSFRSSISEIAAIFEFHPTYMFKDWAASDDQPPRFSPYLALGIGHYHFDPQAQLNGQWVDLQPLHTEGEGFKEYPDRKNYKLDQFNLPVGIGLRYEASNDVMMRLEILDRILFTDYLDDVSTTYINPAYFPEYLSGQQLTDALALNARDPNLPSQPSGTFATPGSIRGKPTNNDNYFTISFKISYILGRDKIE
jgi:Domain of unknown function (DUF6089)